MASCGISGALTAVERSLAAGARFPATKEQLVTALDEVERDGWAVGRILANGLHDGRTYTSPREVLYDLEAWVLRPRV